MSTPERERENKARDAQDLNSMRRACVASNSDITIVRKLKEPIDNGVFDRLVLQQVNRRFAALEPQSQARDVGSRTGLCFVFSQEAIVVLAHYYGINGSVIVRVTRPNSRQPLDAEAKEEHHFVLLRDNRVVDLTADQFWSKGIGDFPKGSEKDELPRVYFRPWKEAIQGYCDIGFSFDSIVPKKGFLKAEFLSNPGHKARLAAACLPLPPPPLNAYGSRPEVPRYPRTVTTLPRVLQETIPSLGTAAGTQTGTLELIVTIETTGRVSDIQIGSPKPKSIHALNYANDVRSSLMKSVYSPATINGKAVRSVIVRQIAAPEEASNPQRP